jgi:transposase
MTEKDTELLRRLVVGHKRDGRRCYDKEAKHELIEACLRPGVSVARMALQHGINANLLRTWISRDQRQRQGQVGTSASGTEVVAVTSAFVPVVQTRLAAKVSRLGLGAQLPNGVKLDLSALGHDELSTILHLLCKLPCSGSTPG